MTKKMLPEVKKFKQKPDLGWSIPFIKVNGHILFPNGDLLRGC